MHLRFKLLQAEREREFLFLHTLLFILSHISIRRLTDAQMNHAPFSRYMCEQCPGKDDDEGEMECQRRSALHFSFDDIESTEGSKYCPDKNEPPCPIVVGMGIICALAFFHDGGGSHAYEHKNVKNEYNLFNHT